MRQPRQLAPPGLWTDGFPNMTPPLYARRPRRVTVEALAVPSESLKSPKSVLLVPLRPRPLR
jgi:hypothetical protein